MTSPYPSHHRRCRGSKSSQKKLANLPNIRRPWGPLLISARTLPASGQNLTRTTGLKVCSNLETEGVNLTVVTGASNEEDSRIVALSGPGQQLSHAPGTSTAMHEQEHKQRVPPNVPNEQLRSHAPGPSPHGKGSGDQNRRERNDQGAVTGSPLSDTPREYQ